MSSELSILKKTLAKYTGTSSLSQVTQGVSSQKLDLALIFDTTGSMYRYLEQVRRELTRLAREVDKAIPNVRIGVVAFGDYCDANTTYVTKVLDLTPDFQQVRAFVGQVEQTGGGDAPEAVEEALFEANQLSWRMASSRAVVLVGDAPPHGVIDAAANCLYGHDYLTEADGLRQKGIKIYATQCGNNATTEQVFRLLARQTSGVYLNLEDIGDLVDLLIGICMKEVGLLEDYTQTLRSQNSLTSSKAKLLKQLKGTADG